MKDRRLSDPELATGSSQMAGASVRVLPFRSSQSTLSPSIGPCQRENILHDNCIAHTDLKPENICLASSGYTYGIPSARNKAYHNLSDTTIRVVDFGCVEYCFSDQVDKFIQTRYYRAPEVVFDMGCNESADIWSIGCIIFELYHGSPLFPMDVGDNESFSSIF